MKELNNKYKFTDEEIKSLKFGIDTHLKEYPSIGLDTLIALEKWYEYYTQVKQGFSQQMVVLIKNKEEKLGFFGVTKKQDKDCKGITVSVKQDNDNKP